MKLMIVSDIHGNLKNTQEIIKIFNSNNSDKLIILGDIYHGYSYSDDCEIANLLSTITQKLILIKGNCDSSMDEDISPTGMYKEYSIKLDGRIIYFNHGHQGICKANFNIGDIYCHGHTHINEIIVDDIIRCCPGSVTLPRAGSKASYMIIDDFGIYIYDFGSTIINKYLFEVENEK